MPSNRAALSCVILRFFRKSRTSSAVYLCIWIDVIVPKPYDLLVVTKQMSSPSSRGEWFVATASHVHACSAAGAMGKSTEMRYVCKLHRERNGVSRLGELRALDRVGWRKITFGRSTVELPISISRKGVNVSWQKIFWKKLTSRWRNQSASFPAPRLRWRRRLTRA